MTPAAVLLIPAEGDPHGLLAEGAPVADYCPGSAMHLRPGWTVHRGRVCWDVDGDFYVTSRTHGCALRLAWDGMPVVEGLDRYARATGGYRWDSSVDLPHMDMSTIVVAWGEQVRRLGLGTLVLLDSDGAVLP